MKNLKRSLLILSVLSLVSCARITIKDQEYCGDAGPLGASCFTTLSNQSRDLTPAEWEEERFGKICTDASNFADNTANILKACRLCKCCTYDAKSKVIQFKENVQAFQGTIQTLY